MPPAHFPPSHPFGLDSILLLFLSKILQHRPHTITNLRDGNIERLGITFNEDQQYLRSFYKRQIRLPNSGGNRRREPCAKHTFSSLQISMAESSLFMGPPRWIS